MVSINRLKFARHGTLDPLLWVLAYSTGCAGSIRQTPGTLLGLIQMSRVNQCSGLAQIVLKFLGILIVSCGRTGIHGPDACDII